MIEIDILSLLSPVCAENRDEIQKEPSHTAELCVLTSCPNHIGSELLMCCAVCVLNAVKDNVSSDMTLHYRHHRLCCALLTSYPSTKASVPSAALGNMKQLPSFQPSSAEKCRDYFCTTKRTPKAIFSANLLRYVSCTDSYPKTQGSGQCGRDVIGFICNRFPLLPSIKTPLTVHKEAQQPPNCIHIRASALFLCVSNYFLLAVQEPHRGHIWILDWSRCLSLRGSIWQTLTAPKFYKWM